MIENNEAENIINQFYVFSPIFFRISQIFSKKKSKNSQVLKKIISPNKKYYLEFKIQFIFTNVYSFINQTSVFTNF